MANRGALGQEKTGIYDPISYETFGKVGNSESGEGYRKVQEVPVTTRVAVDSSDATLTYVGVAIPGSSTGASVWRISRVDASGNELYADGNSLYDNEFDEREALSYS